MQLIDGRQNWIAAKFEDRSLILGNYALNKSWHFQTLK